MIGSGAKVLGPFTVGKGSKIGSNSVVVKEVPENASVVGIPGKVVIREEKSEDVERPDLEHGKMPDPQAKAISCMFDQIRALEDKVADLTAKLDEKESKPSVKKTTKVKKAAAPRTRSKSA